MGASHAPRGAPPPPAHARACTALGAAHPPPCHRAPTSSKPTCAMHAAVASMGTPRGASAAADCVRRCDARFSHTNEPAEGWMKQMSEKDVLGHGTGSRGCQPELVAENIQKTIAAPRSGALVPGSAVGLARAAGTAAGRDKRAARRGAGAETLKRGRGQCHMRQVLAGF